MNAASLRTRGDIPFVGSVRDEGLCVLRSADSGTLEALNLALHSAATAGLAEESDRRTDGPLLQLELRRIGQRPAGAVGTETSLIRTTSAAMSLFGVTPEY